MINIFYQFSLVQLTCAFGHFFYFMGLYFCFLYHTSARVYSLVVRRSYALPGVPPDVSSTRLAPYRVSTALSTLFPALY